MKVFFNQAFYSILIAALLIPSQTYSNPPDQNSEDWPSTEHEAETAFLQSEFDLEIPPNENPKPDDVARVEIRTLQATSGSEEAPLIQHIAGVLNSDQASPLRSLGALTTSEDPTVEAGLESLSHELHSQPVEAKIQSVEFSGREKSFLARYQNHYARTTWTIIKCFTYSLVSYYIVYASSGHFDHLNPLVTVTIGGSTAFLLEKIIQKVENWKPAFAALTRNQDTQHLSAHKKIAASLARLIEPVVAASFLEGTLYYLILQYVDIRNAALAPFEYDSWGVLKNLSTAYFYGATAFFATYAPDMALYKVLEKSKLSSLTKAVTLYHVSTFFAMATFLGNFSDSLHIKWVVPVVSAMAATGVGLYVYAKIDVIKQLLAAVSVVISPKLSDRPWIQRWLSYNLRNDLLADETLDVVAKREAAAKAAGCLKKVQEAAK